MRMLNIRSVLFAGLTSVCAVGLAFMNVGCGSDNGTPSDGGRGGAGGGAGGGSGGGGAGGSGDAGVTHLLSYTFDTSTLGFLLNTYDDVRNLARVPADGGVPDSGTRPTLVHDTADGNPTPGALRITATWTANNQVLEPILGITPPLNLTGKTLKAKVKLVSASGTFPGGVQLFIKTGDQYVYGASAGVSLGPTTVGAWTDLTADLSVVVSADTRILDPSMVREIGLHFYTEATPATPPTYPIETVFEVDTFTD